MSMRGSGGSPSCWRATPDESGLVEMGELMYGSHASYSACGLGSDGTDLLVELVRQAGPAAGLFGAKITGGGSGGTVAILGRSGAGAAVADIARAVPGADRSRALSLRGLVAGCLPVRGSSCWTVIDRPEAQSADMRLAVEDQLNLSMFRAYDIRTPSAAPDAGAGPAAGAGRGVLHPRRPGRSGGRGGA